MKKKGYTIFLISAVLIVLVCVGVFAYKKIRSHYGGYVEEEVVVENKISLILNV